MGENEKSKMLGKNCPVRDIPTHLSNISASSINGSVRVILVDQALDLARLTFLCYWVACDLVKTNCRSYPSR